jgi:hypothetical protein
MVGVADKVKAAVGGGGDLIDGVTSEVGPLDALEVDPQWLDGVEVGGVGGQRFDD